jgi:hypothetical protein
VSGGSSDAQRRTERALASLWRALLDLPELHIVLFAFLLNFAWEILQSGFYRGMREMPHGDAVRLCTLATLGDVGTTLVAFWVVAWLGRGRRWLLRPTWAHVVGFTGLGLSVTLVFEYLATHVWGFWSSSKAMPVIPILEVGLVPLLMWSVLPPLVIWFTHRPLNGSH